jgi:hypothetical protein
VAQSAPALDVQALDTAHDIPKIAAVSPPANSNGTFPPSPGAGPRRGLPRP